MQTGTKLSRNTCPATVKDWNSAKLCLLFGDGWLPLLHHICVFAVHVLLRGRHYDEECTVWQTDGTPFCASIPHSSVWSEHTAPAPVLQFIVTVCSEMFMLTASKAEFSPKPCEHPETGKLAGKDTSRTYSNTVFNGLNIYLLVKIHKSRIRNSVSRFLIT